MQELRALRESKDSASVLKDLRKEQTKVTWFVGPVGSIQLEFVCSYV